MGDLPDIILRSCPLNPRQLLYLGRPQDRTGSPKLGDFEIGSPHPPHSPLKGGMGKD
jgi:hypothetical protein